MSRGKTDWRKLRRERDGQVTMKAERLWEEKNEKERKRCARNIRITDRADEGRETGQRNAKSPGFVFRKAQLGGAG